MPKLEGYTVEFKDFSGGVSTKELASTLCAFANTDGGAVYLGVTDLGDRKGLRVTPALLDQVRNAARDGCVPAVPIELAQIPTTRERHILRIRTSKMDQLHSTASGRCYIRVGTQDKRVLGDELLRLAETKSQTSFEERLLDAGLEVIDRQALDEYYQARRSVSSIGSRLTPEQLLTQIGLGKERPGGYRVKAGAVVLFGKEGDDPLLQREFTFVRYESEDQMYVYREDVRLPAARALQRLIELIRPHNRRTTGIKGLKRTADFLYPEDALREVLLNALAHRDYRIGGLRNECRLYPDRLEIRSAGGFPSFVTLESLGTRHYSRNPKIMHALLILGLVEELGQGIALMRRSLGVNGNPQPEFKAVADQVTVVFKAPREQLGESDVRARLSAYFEIHDTVTRRQVESLLRIGPSMAKRRIAELLASDYLVKEGAARSTQYRRKK